MYFECVVKYAEDVNIIFLYVSQTYSQLAHPIQQARTLGLLFQSKILDIDNIDVSNFTLLHQHTYL